MISGKVKGKEVGRESRFRAQEEAVKNLLRFSGAQCGGRRRERSINEEDGVDCDMLEKV